MIIKHESASVTLKPQDETCLLLTNLYSGQRRQGHATELMWKVIRYADDNNLAILLNVGRYGHPIGPDNTDLETFYKKFGFKQLGDSRHPVVMLREPNN